MIFSPVAFRNQTEPITPPPPSWTPADFTDIKAWWKADSGVTLDATYPWKVGRWEDQVNGYFVTQSQNSATYPNIDRMPSTGSSVDLNNQSTIHFEISTPSGFPSGAPQYLFSTGSFPGLVNQSYTQIVICEYISTKTSGESFSSPIIGQLHGSTTKRIWFDRQISDGDMRNVVGLGAATIQVQDTNTNIALGGEYVLWQQYQAASADTYTGNNTTTGSLRYNGTVTNDTWATTTLFSMNAFLSGTANVGALQNVRASDIHIAEVILIYGEPSASEWAEFKSYVSTTYGITIS